jgi:hypothetical protein
VQLADIVESLKSRLERLVWEVGLFHQVWLLSIIFGPDHLLQFSESIVAFLEPIGKLHILAEH